MYLDKEEKIESSMYLLTLFFIITWISSTFAKEWDEENYPNPFHDFSLCNMDGSSYLCDPDEILSVTQRNRLNDLMIELEEQTRKVSVRRESLSA